MSLLHKRDSLDECIQECLAEKIGPGTMHHYRLYWIGGKSEIVRGYDVADACMRAGISAGALRAMDYFEKIK